MLAEIHDLEQRLQKQLLAAETSENDVSSSQINALKQQVNNMHNCSMLLQVVDKQTTVSDHANPVKAMGLVADPAVLFIILSILAASVWIEIQKIAESLM